MGGGGGMQDHTKGNRGRRAASTRIPATGQPPATDTESERGWTGPLPHQTRDAVHNCRVADGAGDRGHALATTTVFGKGRVHQHSSPEFPGNRCAPLPPWDCCAGS